IDNFIYNAEYRVVVCQIYGIYLTPSGPKQWKSHLRRASHSMRDEELRKTIKLLLTYDL
ncbi:hypothetical protein EDB80DRAFT_591247, partial [Ilyonectria destructans]